MQSELKALAERVMALTGPDRETDAEIAVAALGWFTIPPRYEGDEVGYGYIDSDGAQVRPGHGGKQMVKPFTASLDAAMTLLADDRIARFGGPLVMVRWAMEMLERAVAPADALPRYVTAAALLALAEQVQQ